MMVDYLRWCCAVYRTFGSDVDYLFIGWICLIDAVFCTVNVNTGM